MTRPRPSICCSGKYPIPTRNGASAPSAPSPNSRATATEPVQLGQADSRFGRDAARRRICHSKPHAGHPPFASGGHYQDRLGSADRALPAAKMIAPRTRRVALTEIGPDRQAPREEDREVESCSISASARCRRISASASAIASLAAGCANSSPAAPCSEPGNPAMGNDPRGQSAPRLHQPARPHQESISRSRRRPARARKDRTRMCCRGSCKAAEPTPRRSRS